MHIYFNKLLNINYPINSLSDKLSMGFLNRRVAILALAILSCAAVYYFCCYRFNAKPWDINSDYIHFPYSKRGAKKTEKEMPSGKIKAFEAYKENPKQCGKVKKTIIFQDIKSIESPMKMTGNKNTTSSVVGLMLYVSELSKVDLNHPLCAQIVVDVFKECNKETSEQLSEWLSKEETFNIDLLIACFEVLIEKQQQQLPFSLYAIELLMKIYKEKEWNQVKNPSHHLILPSNDKLIVSVMTILIKEMPNDNKVIALTEWMMDQKEYDLSSFSIWINIFQQKEKEKAAVNLYYPLLDKMIAHFKNRWGSSHLVKLDTHTANYVKSKL